jgi:hypothetical protein
MTVKIIFFKTEDLSSEDNSLNNLNDLYDGHFKIFPETNCFAIKSVA